MNELNFSITSNLSPEIIESKKRAFKSSLLNEKATIIDNKSTHVVVRNGNVCLGALTVSHAHEILQAWSQGKISAKKDTLFLSRGFIIQNPDYRKREIFKLLMLNSLNFYNNKTILTSVRPYKKGVQEVIEIFGFKEYGSMQSYHSIENNSVELILFKLENYNLDFEQKKSEILSNIQPAF
ncbi:hypothetical protein [Gramella sp. KN1008]|uniref:hypothetical protein n=1 Tax=Gramella sp. KN1008 TaxID=2529298 RepID=UPI00103B6712|nr:hypothetical protein [Gramella sp. KN1008]TBW28247.1 hypothetical protein EZJ28_05740 [Gramella sp. KN1008]